MPEPKYLVFSDVDETLIHCKSMFDFLEYFLVHRHGQAGAARYEQVWQRVKAENAAGRDRREINREYYREFAGERIDVVTTLGRRWHAHKRDLGVLYLDATKDALRSHVADGAELVLVSGSFGACLNPVAEDVGARHLLCAELRTAGDVYTGEIVEPVIGQGKQAAVERLLAACPEIDPADCYGYGDHSSDIPMLELVGHPEMVGDNAELRAYIESRRTTA